MPFACCIRFSPETPSLAAVMRSVMAVCEQQVFVKHHISHRLRASLWCMLSPTTLDRNDKPTLICPAVSCVCMRPITCWLRQTLQSVSGLSWWAASIPVCVCQSS